MAGRGRPRKVSDDTIMEAYNRLNGSITATAKELNMERRNLQYRLDLLGERSVDDTLNGLVQRKAPVDFPLPKAKDKPFRYIITAAQNNTKVNRRFLDSLETLAVYYDAQILVSRFTYNKSNYGSKSVKPGTSDLSDIEELWYDPAIEEYICDDRIKLAPGLIFVGDMNVLPTASNPLSGLDGFTGRASGIFPHAKIAMSAVASSGREGTKHNYTTGVVTRRNYVQKKAGQKAEFHHAYAALIVEVDSDGDWFVRQINADGRSRIADLDVFVDGDTITVGNTIEAFTPGDIHASEADEVNAETLWGEGGVIDTLKPKKQFLHDLFSFRSRSHHEMKSFHKMVEKFFQSVDDVEGEVRQTVEFCKKYLTRPWLTNYVVRSNHDEHLDKWLDTCDYRYDLPNAEFFLECQLEMVRQIKAGKKDFNILEWAMHRCGLTKADKLTFLGLDDSLITCPNNGGGIENAMHGDKGPNGARGTLPAFARMARKLIIGHAHSAGIQDGVYRTGTSSMLRLSYNHGPSSWSHTHCITYANGKRTLITVWNGKAWADRSYLT